MSVPATPLQTLVSYLADLPDPRIARTRRYRLLTLLLISLCAVLCGAQGWDDFADFAHAKREWLHDKLGLHDLAQGTPCADTFRRVFARLDPLLLEAVFRRWTQTLSTLTHGEVIALDGKTIRHSFDTATGQKAIHLVSAWASQARLVLGQVKVADKSNEITAVPALLALLDIAGCTVTADAMSCQRDIAAQIVQQGADYVLAVKDNQKTLAQNLKNRFDYAHKRQWRDVAHTECSRTNKGHGRWETRRCDVIALADNDLFWGETQQQWAGLRSLVRVISTRQVGTGRASRAVRYFISTLTTEAKHQLSVVRHHWGIENSLHHVLDVSLHEDDSRVRKDNGAENLSVVRHIALNLLRQEKTCKRGVKARQKKAGWDNDYLARLLVCDTN